TCIHKRFLIISSGIIARHLIRLPRHHIKPLDLQWFAATKKDRSTYRNEDYSDIVGFYKDKGGTDAHTILKLIFDSDTNVFTLQRYAFLRFLPHFIRKIDVVACRP